MLSCKVDFKAINSSENKICIISLRGTLSSDTIGKLERALTKSFNERIFKIIIDLADVEFISSAGWGTLVGELKYVKENGGDIKLADMQTYAYEIYQLLEFNNFIKAFDTVEEAEREFKKDIYVVVKEAEQESMEDIYTVVEESDQESEEDIYAVVKETDQEFEEDNYPVVEEEEQEFKEDIYAVTEEEDLNSKEDISPVVGEDYNQYEEDEEITIQSENNDKKSKFWLIDMILKIVKKNPKHGPLLIKKELETPKYGCITISKSTIYRKLKKVELNTKEKRFQYCFN